MNFVRTFFMDFSRFVERWEDEIEYAKSGKYRADTWSGPTFPRGNKDATGVGLKILNPYETRCVSTYHYVPRGGRKIPSAMNHSHGGAVGYYDAAPPGAIEVALVNIAGVLTPEGSRRIAHSSAMGYRAWMGRQNKNIANSRIYSRQTRLPLPLGLIFVTAIWRVPLPPIG